MISDQASKNGAASNKSIVIEFANSVRNDMEYQDKVKSAKKLHGLHNVTQLGVRWYHNFLNTMLLS